MSCFSQRLRRTAPMHGGSSRNELVPFKSPRMNGWSWPPQAFQVIGWLVYSYFAIISFGIYIPLLPLPWNHVVYTVSLNTQLKPCYPADASVRAKQNYSGPMPLFDRTKQAHVIQDLHCYLCDVKVGPKVKHCGVCNKCVQDFDHHCKWLNTCVGSRNYWYFFVALSSATLGVFLLVVVILFIFIQHYLNPNSLRTDPHFQSELGNGTWLVFLPLAPIKTSSAGLLILAFITVMLSISCLLLLTHLLGFHFYLFHKGISTYDYVKMQRQKQARNRDIEAGNPHDANKTPQLENFKISAEKENGFHYGTENPTENTTTPKDASSSNRLFITSPLSAEAPSPAHNNEARGKQLVPHSRSQSAGWFLFSITEGASHRTDLSPGSGEDRDFEAARRAIMAL
eukprot:superscaffoldBa00000949_g8144